MTIVQVPATTIPNVPVDVLVQCWNDAQAFQQKERERLARYYLNKKLKQAGVSSLEEYKKIKDPRGCKMKYFDEQKK